MHDKRQKVLVHKGLVFVDRVGDSAERLKAAVPRHIGKGALGRGVSLPHAHTEFFPTCLQIHAILQMHNALQSAVEITSHFYLTFYLTVHTHISEFAKFV